MKTVAGGAVSVCPEKAARKAEERSNIYGFLAGVYREEPTPSLLREIRGIRFREALSEAGVALGKDFLERPEQELLLDLAVEYTRLFIGPGKHVSPHESAQMEGALWGRATSEVVRFIEGSGFRYKPVYRGIPDHISVELEFMQEVTRAEAKARERGDDGTVTSCLRIEKEFIDQHLARWVPRFCEKVVAEAELPFYREMAKLAHGFIESEKDEIGKSAETERGAGRDTAVP